MQSYKIRPVGRCLSSPCLDIHVVYYLLSDLLERNYMVFVSFFSFFPTDIYKGETLIQDAFTIQVPNNFACSNGPRAHNMSVKLQDNERTERGDCIQKDCKNQSPLTTVWIYQKFLIYECRIKKARKATFKWWTMSELLPIPIVVGDQAHNPAGILYTENFSVFWAIPSVPRKDGVVWLLFQRLWWVGTTCMFFDTDHAKVLIFPSVM